MSFLNSYLHQVCWTNQWLNRRFFLAWEKSRLTLKRSNSIRDLWTIHEWPTSHLKWRHRDKCCQGHKTSPYITHTIYSCLSQCLSLVRCWNSSRMIGLLGKSKNLWNYYYQKCPRSIKIFDPLRIWEIKMVSPWLINGNNTFSLCDGRIYLPFCNDDWMMTLMTLYQLSASGDKVEWERIVCNVKPCLQTRSPQNT